MKNNKSEEELVSIIIPNYNHSEYLGRSIRSALNQTYKNIEIIVVDDGSTDNSLRIAEQYEKNGVHLIKKRHTDQQDTCNVGVSRSKGKYFVFLDADDLLHPQYVELTLEHFKKNPSKAFVYTQHVRFGVVNILFRSQKYDPCELYVTSNNFITSTSLMKKEVYEQNGGHSVSIPYFYDYDFYLTLAENGFEGVLLDKPLFFYRKTDGHSVSNKKPFEALLMYYQIRKRHSKLAKRLSLLQKMRLSGHYCSLLFFSIYHRIPKIAQHYCKRFAYKTFLKKSEEKLEDDWVHMLAVLDKDK